MKDYSFGNYICALRNGMGLSQYQLGVLVGVTDKAVSKWENGNSKPRLSTYHRLADVFNVHVDELLSCDHEDTNSMKDELKKLNNDLWERAYERLSVFGTEIPTLCMSRLAAEETALKRTDIIQGFAILGALGNEMKEEGISFYSSEIVDSSFTAWLLGATKVNPLPPHYRCPACGNTIFVQDVSDGFDLPEKICACGERFLRDGHDLPFECYANFKSISLRIAEKNKELTSKIIKCFYEKKAEVLPIKLIDDTGYVGCMEYYVILKLGTQLPKVARDGFWYTNLETYNHWKEGRLVISLCGDYRLDKIRKLREQTQIRISNPASIVSPRIIKNIYEDKLRKLENISEFTNDERCDFDLLLRVTSLGRSPGVWRGNAECIIASQRATFRELPMIREHILSDVLKALREHGIYDNGSAMKIMKDAANGTYFVQGVDRDLEEAIIKLGLPSWYLEYLKKIMYIAPKTMIVSILLLESIIEWYHINYPESWEKNL